MNRDTILVVEDCPDTAQAIRIALGKGYEIVDAGTARDALQVLDSRQIDLALVDLGLPDGSGFDVCDHVRQRPVDSEMPVVFLSASCDTDDKVSAFQRDAEDYITKPFEPVELRARIAAFMRRASRTQSNDLEVGRIRLDVPGLRAQVVDGDEIDLTSNEFRLLLVLGRSVDQVISRREILSAVWPGVSVAPRTIDTHVCHLRRKLTEVDAQLEIESVRGAGYRLQTHSD